MKIQYKIFLLILLGRNFGFDSKACSPFLPTLLSQSVSNGSLVLTWQTNNSFTTGCPNVIDVEIACCANNFGGVAYATFTTAPYTPTSTPMVVPTQFIDILSLCPGCYKFRARERTSTGVAVSPWTSTFTFNIPGFFNPPVLNLQSSTYPICPPQSTTLTALITIDCGTPPYTYSWTGVNMSCYTCSNPIVSPTITTTYTCVVTGGQLGCWTASASITIYINPIPPVIGPASAYPPTVCTGSTTVVGLAFYNGSIVWQSSPNATGPWTNVPNGNGYNFVSSALTTTVYYRAMVQGCMSLDSSNVVQVLVTPNPTLSVPNVLICPGQTATITASGANSYFWSSGAFPSGPNTGGAAPLTTTNYTVTGLSATCTDSVVVTVSVGATPLLSVSDQTVCFNQNLNLTASGSVSYEWLGPLSFTSSQQSPTIPNASTSMSGQYTVTGYSAFGCTNTAVSNITVLSLFSPTIQSNNPVCDGASINFTATGATSYTWNGPNLFTTTNPMPVINNISFASGGVYSLVGAIGACTGTSTIFIIVKTSPSPVAQNNSPVCDGFPVAFSALGGVTYTWSGPSGFVTASQNPTISNMYLNNAGNYTVSVSGANGCISSAITVVTVNPLPLIPVTDQTVCLHSPVNLVAGGGVIYSWAGPNGFSSTLQNPVIPNSTFALSGQYSVSVVSAENCSNNAVENIVIIGVPSPSILSVGSICVGSTLALQGVGANSYVWNGPSGFTSALSNPFVNNIGLPSSGIYTLSATQGICTTIVTKSITVLPLPLVSIGTSSACETKSLQLTAVGGATNQWYSPTGVYSQQNSYIIPYVALSTAGIYTVIVTGANSCSIQVAFPVSVYPNPTVVASGATVCAGQPAVIKSSGGATYLWSGPAAFSSTVANATIPSVNYNTIGNYVIVAMAANSCTTGVSVAVDLIAIPQPSIIVTPTVCFNTEVRLEATGGISYQWNGPFDFVSTNQITTFTALSMGASGIYTLSALNNSGCVGYTTTLITVLPMPEGPLNSSDKTHCVPFCADFGFANKYNIPITNTTWRINNQTFNTPMFNYCFFEPGNYLVTGNFGDVNGCANTSTFLVNAYESPKADFTYFPTNPVEVIDEVQFKNNSTGNHITKWTWSFISNGGYKSDAENTNYYFAEAGNYPVSLVVNNAWGCADTMIRAIIVDEDFSIFVPNSFTPNDDGKNETFQPKGRGVVTYQLMIHDRWGEKIFETKDFSEGWDGSYKGKPCKAETYQWKILASDRSGKTKDLWGHVTLYR